MNIGEYSVKTPVVSWLLIIIMVGGGIWGFEQMGKLEDPAFTIKLAKIITYYPGASAQEVQDEITYHIEDAIQRMEQVWNIKMSVSRPGVSDILIEFKSKYRAKDFPAIFDELRRKIADMKGKLPPGAQEPNIIDEFGDVYGVYYALTGEGYSWRDLWDFADRFKRQLVLVPGVRKITIDGEQKETVYVEMSRARMGELGISVETIAQILQSQNVVADAGNVRVGDEYLRIEPTGEFSSVKAIGNVLIGSDERRLIYLSDIAEIVRAYDEVPTKLYYVNGKRALTLGISMQGGENVVAVGERLAARAKELESTIPAGMELVQIYNQPLEVDKSVSGFLVSVGQAVAIVIIVLLLFMGLRIGLIIGAVLLITVAGTLLIMNLTGIELQRISLGALVIALGMLVDNAIVVAEGMMVRMQAGMRAAEAAGEAVGKTIWALLGGTVIGILAFSAIGLSPDSTGEFANSLFWVILYSLLLSWVTGISTTPLLCALLLKPGQPGEGEPKDPYGGLMFRLYRGFVDLALRLRWLTVAVVLGLFVAALIGFGSVQAGLLPGVQYAAVFCRRLGDRGHRHPPHPRRHPQGERVPARPGGGGADHHRGRRPPPALHPGLRLQGSGGGLFPDHRPDRQPGAHRRGVGQGRRIHAHRAARRPIPLSSPCASAPAATARSRPASTAPSRPSYGGCPSRSRPLCAPTRRPRTCATTGASR